MLTFALRKIIVAAIAVAAKTGKGGVVRVPEVTVRVVVVLLLIHLSGVTIHGHDHAQGLAHTISRVRMNKIFKNDTNR